MQNSSNRSRMVLGGICSLVAVGMGVRYWKNTSSNKLQRAPSPVQQQRTSPAPSSPIHQARGHPGTISPIVRTEYQPQVVDTETTTTISNTPGGIISVASNDTGIFDIVVETDGNDDEDIELGSYVRVAEIEDVAHHSLWNQCDSSFCGRFGFVRRVDPDGDVEVSFPDSTSVVCDRRFICVEEAPNKSATSLRSCGSTNNEKYVTQGHRNSWNAGGLSTSAEYPGGMGGMASSFCEMSL